MVGFMLAPQKMASVSKQLHPQAFEISAGGQVQVNVPQQPRFVK